MSGKPMVDELATKADIVAALDALACAPRRPPPPHDLEAEALAVAAARWGYVAAVDPKDFYSDARGAIFGAVRELRSAGLARITDDGIIRLLEVSGWVPIRIRDELEALRIEPRAVRLDEVADRIRSCARRRRALDLVLRAEEQLRGGGDDAAVADLLVRAADEVDS